MAIESERLIIDVEARVNRLERELRRGASTADRQFSIIERRANEMARKIDRTTSNMFRNMAAPLGGLTAALGTAEIVRYADAWTEAGNRLRASEQATGSSARSLTSIKDAANDARTSLETYAQTYSTIMRVTAGLVKSEQEVADITEIVSKAFVAGGASASEAASGMLQLGQALQSGVLQGDELRSLLENAPLLAQLIADEFGVAVGQLKQLGADGELTANRVVRAITNGGEKVRNQFNVTNATIRDGFTRLRNEFIAYIGLADSSAGASQGLVAALTFLAENFHDVADAVVQFATILISALAGRAIATTIGGLANAVRALGVFITAVRAGTAANLAFTASLGPIGVLAGLAAGAIFLLATRENDAITSTETFATKLERLLEIKRLLQTATGDFKDELENERAELEASTTAYTENAKAALANAQARLAAAKAAQATAEEAQDPAYTAALQARLEEARARGDQSAIRDLEGLIATGGDRRSAEIYNARANSIAVLEEEVQRLTQSLETLNQTTVQVTRTATERERSLSTPPTRTATSASSGKEVTSQQLYNTLEKFVGLNENRDRNELASYFKSQGINIDPSKTAWCMAIINAVLNDNKLPGSGSLAARSALNLGTATDNPVQGDLVVLSRGTNQAQGHVGLFSGYDERGNVRVLGGNQSDGVNVQSYSQDRVLGFRRVAGVDANAQADNIAKVIKLREDEAEAARKSGEEQLASYQKIVAGGAEYIVQLQLEAEAKNLTAEQAAALRFEQDLLSQAQQAGITLSKEQKDQLKLLAEGMASAEIAARDLAEMQKELSELAEGAFKGFAKDLADGKTAAEAFESVLGRIADKLLDMALDGLFQSASGGSSGGLFGFLGSLFGGGRATGGTVSSQKIYKVGEKGPELFAPGRSGTIIPNHNLPSLAAPTVVMPSIKQDLNISILNNTGVAVSARQERQTDGTLRVTLDKAIASNLNTRGTETSNAIRNGYGARQTLVQR